VSTDRVELERAARLLNDVFAHSEALTADALRWYYDENPVAAAAVGRVEDGDRRVGNYALIPQVYIEPGGTRRTLGVGVDLAVAPEARGAGTFRRTVEDAYGRGTAAGFDGILGVANANSAPRMVSTLGWRALEPLPVTLCQPLGRPSDLVDHLVDDDLLEGPVFERLTDGGFVLPDHHGFAPLWTPEVLRWRLRRPGARYWLHASDDLLVVSTRTHLARVPFGVVLKVLARPGLDRPVPIGHVAAALARCHHTPFVVHWGRNPWLRIRGVRLPQSRMPSPLSLVLHSFQEGFVPASFELAGMEFLDFDAY
jgi:GNAT superfamily N-acetyltransferase